MATTDRIRQAEQQLRALSLLIDGRHSRDGYLTWTMIADTVGYCWQLLAAELDGHPNPALIITPVDNRRAETQEITFLAELAADLAGRLENLTGHRYRIGALSV
jgi:hypothetical protein